MNSEDAPFGFTLLQGHRIVQMGSGIALSYCTKLLVDAGAEVVMVESADGDPLRRRRPCRSEAVDEGILFRYLSTSKQSIVGTIADQHVQDVLDGSQLLVEQDGLSVEGLARLCSDRPSLSVVSISPFGRGGVWQGRPWSDLVLQAGAGSVGSRGYSEREPVQVGGEVGQWIAGSFASVAAAALLLSSDAGKTDVADLSVFECMAIAMHGYAGLKASLGGSGFPASSRQVELPSIEPARDGYVCFTTNSRQQFEDFLLMIQRPDLLEDEKIQTQAQRQKHRDDFVRWVSDWTSKRTTEEIVETAAALRIPVAVVSSPSDVFTVDHFVERGIFVTNPDGVFRQPRPPIRVIGSASVPLRPAPTVGEHRPRDAGAGLESRAARARDALPLDELRIVDLTAWWAGPSVCHMLGALGADIIKIESTSHPDGQRLSNTAQLPPSPNWWETGYLFQSVNVNKRGIAVDLRTTEGLDILWRLIECSDALVENFSPRVLDSFGVTWDAVHSRNPRLTMVRMPAFGLDGPWRERTGFAQTMEAVSGMAWQTGYADTPPILPRGLCDPLAGMHAAFSLVAGLLARRRTGLGVHIESPMVETVLCAASEAAMVWSQSMVLDERSGNRSQIYAPQGVYRCKGDDEWVALTVRDDTEWRKLEEELGRQAWKHATGTSKDRGEAHDEIDTAISAWTSCQTADDAADRLTALGIPALRVALPVEVQDNVQLRARGFIETIDHPLLGRHDVLGIPFRLESMGTRPWVRSPAPTLGQHNDEVLADLLGMEHSEISALRANGIIGTGLAQ